jgi:hypothetical protein
MITGRVMQAVTPEAHASVRRAGAAYWAQRHVLAGHRERIEQLGELVGRRHELEPHQWAQLMALALDFGPDLILELGRDRGNSTCAFTEVAHLHGPGSTRVVSICLSRDWEKHTAPQLRSVVGEEWFGPLTAMRRDIAGLDWASVLLAARRVLVFWDAHGFTVAQEVLAALLPALRDREHLVVMHDLTDARYEDETSRDYAGKPIWRGNFDGTSRLRLGALDTRVEQAIAVTDFASRNRLPLHSADESVDLEIGRDEERVREMEERLGELFRLRAHWFWFTLAEAQAPLTFPGRATRRRLPLRRRLREAARVLLRD